MTDAPVRASVEEKVWQPSPLRRIVLLGMGKSITDWIMESYSNPLDFSDSETQVWAVNAAASCMKHHVAWHMHRPEDLPENHLRLIENLTSPVIMTEHFPSIPSSLEFPLHEIIDFYRDNYFRNSISYLIAAAGMCNPKRFGVELEDDGRPPITLEIYGADYNYPPRADGTPNPSEEGRANVEYWLATVRQKEVQIKTGASTTLLDANLRGESFPLYGYTSRQPDIQIEDGKLVLKSFPKSFSEVFEILESPGSEAEKIDNSKMPSGQEFALAA